MKKEELRTVTLEELMKGPEKLGLDDLEMFADHFSWEKFTRDWIVGKGETIEEGLEKGSDILTPVFESQKKYGKNHIPDIGFAVVRLVDRARELQKAGYKIGEEKVLSLIGISENGISSEDWLSWSVDKYGSLGDEVEELFKVSVMREKEDELPRISVYKAVSEK